MIHETFFYKLDCQNQSFVLCESVKSEKTDYSLKDNIYKSHI